MDLFRFLPKFGRTVDKVEEAPTEHLERLETEKRERVKFHRDHVRNGPAKTRRVTNGQVRRSMLREQKTKLRKQNRNNRRDFMRAQHDLAILRGQLTCVGALGTRPNKHLQRNALRGLFDGYGVLVEQTLEIDQLDFDNDEHRRHVVEAALHHYQLATGQVAA